MSTDPWAAPEPIGPHITRTGVQEWQQLSWAMAADDAGVDLTTVTDDTDWMDQAAAKFGTAAVTFARTYDALMTVRFGAETAPAAAPAPALQAVPEPAETAEAFARHVQKLVYRYANDQQLRDTRIATAALEYAAQFLPAGLDQPLSDPPGYPWYCIPCEAYVTDEEQSEHPAGTGPLRDHLLEAVDL